MALHHAFDALSQIVEQVERRGQPVRAVDATTDPDTAGVLYVSMTLPVPLCGASSGTLGSALSLEQASLEDGDLTLTLSVSDLLPAFSTDEPVVDVDEQAVQVDDGTLVVTVGFRIEPAESMAATTTGDEVTVEAEQPRDSASSEPQETTDGNSETLAARLLAARSDDVPADDVGSDENELAARLERVRSDDVPAYEDTDYLRLLYESCDTFTEMRDRIEMDVAAETVRRYMIEADIHSPRSYDTTTHDATGDADADDTGSATADSDTALENAGSDPSPTEQQFVTDGIGLPDGVAVEDIVTAVADATTVYDVQQSLDLDRGRTHDLLRQLNVLDLVLHRIDDRPRGVSKTDVVQRIRQCDAEAACGTHT